MWVKSGMDSVMDKEPIHMPAGVFMLVNTGMANATYTHWNHNRSNSSLLGKISITVLAGQQPQTPRHMDH